MGQNESKKNPAFRNSKPSYMSSGSNVPMTNTDGSPSPKSTTGVHNAVTSQMEDPPHSLEAPQATQVSSGILSKEVNIAKVDLLAQGALNLQDKTEVVSSMSSDSLLKRNLFDENRRNPPKLSPIPKVISEVNQSSIGEEKIFKAETLNFDQDNQPSTNSNILELGQQMDKINIDGPNPKILERKLRKNVSKGVGSRHPRTKASVSATLKHVDKLAENLSGFALASSVKSTNIAKTTSHCKTMSLDDFTIEECISQVQNIHLETEFTPALHQALVNNLQIINRFILALKTAPVLSREIVAEVNILKDYVSSLPSQHQSVQSGNVFVNLPSLTTTSGNQFVMDYANQEPDSNLKNNMGTTTGSSGFRGVLKNNVRIVPQPNSAQCGVILKDEQKILPFKEFKTLLDELPDELSDEKQNISFQKSQLYCETCKKIIPSVKGYLIEHLKSHNSRLKDTEFVQLEKQQHIPSPMFKEGACLPSPEGASSLSLDQNVVQNNFALPPKYQQVLNIIFTSHKDKLTLDIEVYICRFCDIVLNNIEDAESHLSDNNHVIQQNFQPSKWEFCKSCCVYIYCTQEHFEEHCSTVQHIYVTRLKNENSMGKPLSVGINSSDSGLLTKVVSAPVSDSINDLSSGVQKKPNPQEMLLTLTKDHRDKITGAPFGMYCQICNDYTVYSTSVPDHLQSGAHKSMLTLLRGTDQCELHFCKACQVDLFGDKGVLIQHNSLPIHLQLEKDSKQEDQGESESDSDELSNEHGAYFDLMKAVLKKHVQKESKSGVFGFYCHVCSASFDDECSWRKHVDSASHFNRINSSECVGKKMSHDCVLCKIHMICDENTYLQHKISSAHVAIHRYYARDNPTETEEVVEELSDEENSDDDSESYGDESNTVEDSDTQSNCSSNQQANKNQSQNRRVLKTGVYIKGLPRNVKQKDVFEEVKRFGYVKSCSVDKFGNAKVHFQKKADAEKVLNIKSISLGNNVVSVLPLLGPVKVKRQKKNMWELHSSVGIVLQSKPVFRSFVYKLETEMKQEDGYRGRKQALIQRDIYSVLPSCKVHFFGSQVTGLATNQSDYDIYIDYDNRSYFNHLPEMRQGAIIHELLDIFTRPRSRFQVTEPVLDARVPIIRVIHKETNTLCDISCRSGLSVENSHLIRQYIAFDARVRWLVIVVKWWMRANGLLNYRIFTSYATTWLVLFFLMRLHERIICPVTTLQKGVPGYFIAGWDCRFTRDIDRCFKTVNSQSKFVLLLEFFKYYASFHLKNIVLCPLTATVIPRKQFDQLDGLPLEFIPYVKRVSTNPNAEKLRTTTPICLQDPFDLAHNVTKGVGAKDLQKFQDLCAQCVKLCENWIKN